MKEPTRFLSGSGPARDLMQGSVLRVPRAARERALQFTSVAVGMSASGTAMAAGATSLVKSLVLTISLGAVGGGLVSLGASEAISRFDAPQAPVSVAAPHKVVVAPGTPAVAPPPVVEPAPAPPPESPVTPAPSEPEARPVLNKNRTSFETPPSASVGNFTEARPSLFEEQRIIESARASVARGDAAGALATLDSYDRSYAQKQFGPEALALRVQALAAAGQLAAARSLARDFEQRYPHHPLLARVQSVVGR